MLIPLGFLAASGAGAAGSFDLLETQVLSGSQASVTFSSLNATYGTTYKHLQVRFVFRQTANDVTMLTRLNGATSTYANHNLFGNGAGVVSNTRSSPNAGALLYTQDYASAPANAFFSGAIDVLDAFSTTKNKTLRVFAGGTGSGTEQNKIYLTSGAWFSTDAMTSLAFSLGTGASPAWETQSFTQHSRFSLYGIKG